MVTTSSSAVTAAARFFTMYADAFSCSVSQMILLS
jgi:hypothetical protein